MKQRAKESPSDTISRASRAPSLNTINDYIESHNEILSRVDDINFSTPQYCRDLGRKAGLSVLTMHILTLLGIEKLPHMN